MKGGFFPHGAIQSDDGNLWRETGFALHIMQQAVNPKLNLLKCIENWNNIQKKLSEKHRSRKVQMNKLNILS